MDDSPKFCFQCGEKLKSRYPGGDPECGPAEPRCGKGHPTVEEYAANQLGRQIVLAYLDEVTSNFNGEYTDEVQLAARKLTEYEHELDNAGQYEGGVEAIIRQLKP